MKNSQTLAKEFLDLPEEALPSAQFAEEEDSWAHDAWAVLREHAKTGEPLSVLCGTGITLRADRDEWRNGVTIQ